MTKVKTEEKKEEAVVIEDKKDNVEEMEIVKELGESEEKKERVVRDEKIGIAYIYSTQNNTMVHITDLAGNTLSRVSGGMVTKHSRLKADPTIAMFIVKKASERAKDLGINSLYIRTRGQTGAERGIGPGAHAAVKSFEKQGFRIISVLDTTRVPRGGPKRKGGKRGRRV